MSKSKLAALVMLASGCVFALGLNCIPNLGAGVFGGLTTTIRNALGLN